jgi:phosphate/sulfate permease
LSGIGLAAGQAHLNVIGSILQAWVLTLPCAALIGATAYWALS